MATEAEIAAWISAQTSAIATETAELDAVKALGNPARDLRKLADAIEAAGQVQVRAGSDIIALTNATTVAAIVTAIRAEAADKFAAITLPT